MTTYRGHEAGICSACGSEDVIYERSGLEADEVYYELLCNNCGANGQEWYRLRYIETVMVKEAKEK